MSKYNIRIKSNFLSSSSLSDSYMSSKNSSKNSSNDSPKDSPSPKNTLNDLQDTNCTNDSYNNLCPTCKQFKLKRQ